MILLKCKVCGDTLQPDSKCCESCGTPVADMSLRDDKLIESMNRANDARLNYDFDEAIRAYTGILENDEENAEAHWNLALSRFGIEYEFEKNSAGQITSIKPNFHRLNRNHFKDDPDYNLALIYADETAQQYYQTEGERITALQEELLKLVQREKDYDVFISFKDSDGQGGRTRDSQIAEDIYQRLVTQDLKTFFSRVTLQEVSGDMYEAHIFKALETAKIMILVGTDYANITSGWVRNEWSRYLDLMAKDKGGNKKFVFVYENMALEMLDQLGIPRRDAVDWSSKDSRNDLIHYVNTTLGKRSFSASSDEIKTLVKRSKEALDQKNFAEAMQLAADAARKDPQNNFAALYQFLAENRVSEPEELDGKIIDYHSSIHFDAAYRNASVYHKQILDDLRERYDREQERLQKDEAAAKQAEWAKENSKKQAARARAEMISGNYAEAQRLLTDNIVMTPEISDMLNDCELGLEYQKINTRTYLHDRLSAAVPEKMAELDRLASSLSQKYSGFGAQDAGMRMFLPLLCLISMVGFVIAVLINNSDMIVMFPMTASIAGGILFYRYYRIMAGPAANAFMLILRFWVAEMIAMITMMLPYGILGKMGIFGKLLGGLVSVGIYGFLFLFGYHDYEESKKAGSNKAEDYYRSVIKPEEDKLAAEYQRKYQVLADKYAPLKKLSSAWEVYLEKEGDEE
ncbi:MAG TPA: hypothetical protein DHW39_01340 [Erysipelotrichaceae bacterium]|nr:hypothetical protein [Erysipelotrichaceae bacterium]